MSISHDAREDLILNAETTASAPPLLQIFNVSSAVLHPIKNNSRSLKKYSSFICQCVPDDTRDEDSEHMTMCAFKSSSRQDFSVHTVEK